MMLVAMLLIACTSDTGENENDNNHEQPENEMNNNAESNGEDNNNENEPNQSEPWAYDGEPTTVRMLINVGDEEFNNRYKRQVEEKFPNIKLELMAGDPTNNEELEELFAKQDIPDIITVNPNHELVVGLDALEPIDDYIEKSGFDLDVFGENIVENLRSRDPRGENNLYGLPIESTLITMYYNKDIFDQFGEPYPTNDMTWEDTLDLTRRLTVESEGTQYKGIVFDPSYAIPYTQFSIPGTDPESGEILFADHPDTRRFFEFLDELRSIPGLFAEEEDGFHDGARNYAMRLGTAPWLPLLAPIEGFNFDMVPVPTWEGESNVAPTTVALSYNILKYSENKDAAWSVISYLATEEAQITLSRAGMAPTVESQDAYEQFGALVVEEYGKEYQSEAAFINPVTEMAPYSKYGPEITFHGSNFITEKSAEFLQSDKDVITFIREMAEEYEANVEEMKGQE